MTRTLGGVLLLMVLFVLAASAQTPVITNSGTTGTIPLFNGASGSNYDIENSILTQSTWNYSNTYNNANLLLAGGVISANGSYFNVLAYNLNSTPQNGIKILTSIPYTASAEMPTIIIHGYDYSKAAPIGLILNWYIESSGFVDTAVASFGGDAPQIKLAQELNNSSCPWSTSGCVVIFINEQSNFERFTVDAYAHGMSEQPQWFTGWTFSDSAINSNDQNTTPYLIYKNNFPNLGVGTYSPAASLSVITQSSALTGTSNPYGLYLYPSSSSGTSYVDSVTSGSGGTNLSLRTYNNGTYSNGLFINSSGEVGVGTTSPASLFSVGTSSQFQVGTTGAVTASSIGVSGTVTAAAFSGSGSGLTGIPSSAISGGVSSVFGRTGAVAPAANDYSVSQISGAAPLASPAFTGNVGISGNLNVTGFTDSLFHTGNTSAYLSTYFNNAASQGSPAWDTLSIGANWNDGPGTVVNSQEGTALFQMRTNYGGAGSNGAMITLGVGNINSTPTATFETITTNGIGIGTTTPGANPPPGYVSGTPILEVSGDVVLTSGKGGFITFSDGSVQSTAYPGAQTLGGDYAESVDVSGSRNEYEPGDLLVIDPDDPSRFLKASEPYSTSVSGIFSTKPGTIGRRQTTPKSPDEIPMAVVGIVPAKVSAENGPIRPGDLLVSSSTPGYAMKGTDRNQMLGAVVGKAMGRLVDGTGVIEVLVTLQ